MSVINTMSVVRVNCQVLTGLLLVAMLVGSFRFAYANESSSSSGFRFIVLGSKVMKPIRWTYNPLGPDGKQWYSPAYNDQAWQAGLLDATNPIPPNMSKVWRICVRVDEAAPRGESVTLRVQGDDAVTVYLDGFQIGQAGNAAEGKPGIVQVDVGSRLTSGMHVFGVRVDNGPAGSRMKFSLVHDAPGSIDWLKKNYYRIMALGDEAERRNMIQQARDSFQTASNDVDMIGIVLHSMTAGPKDLRDVSRAERWLNEMLRKNVKVPLESQVTVARAAGTLQTCLPALKGQAADKTNARAGLLLADVLREIGEEQSAKIAYEEAFMSGNPSDKETLRQRLTIVDRLLDMGQTDAASRPLAVLGEHVRRTNDGALLAQLGEIYERFGHGRVADDLYARSEQYAGRSSYAVRRRVRRLLNTGQFEAAAALVAASDRDPVTSTVRETLHVLRSIALAEMGRTHDAKASAAKIMWDSRSRDELGFLARYSRVARALSQMDPVMSAARKLDAAITQAVTDSKYYKPDPEVLTELARSLQFAGQQARARVRAEEVLNLVSDASLPENQHMRGEAQLILNDTSAARESFTRCLGLDTENYWAKKRLAELVGKP